MDFSDDYIIDKLTKGDRKIFEYVYTRYVNALYAYGKGFGLSDNELQDILHDLFLSFLVTPGIFAGVKSVKSYLFASFKNRILNVLKIPREYNDIHQYEHLFVAKVDLLDEMIDREEADRRKRQVQSLLESLTSRQQEAIYLRYMQKLSYDEIAQILRLTPKGARKLVARGIEQMRGKITKEVWGIWMCIITIF